MSLFGPLLSAGTSLLGGLLQAKGQKAANAANQANFQQSLLFNDRQFDASMANNQEQFATNTYWSNYWNRRNLQWARIQRRDQLRRIRDVKADAEAAGVHPLFALGAAGNFSPVSFSGQGGVGGGGVAPTGAPGFAPQSGSALGDGIAAAGQAISTGVADALSRKERRELNQAAARRQARIDLANQLRLEADIEAIRAGKAKDQAMATYYLSAAKRNEQTVLSKRSAGDGIGGTAGIDTGTGVRIIPLGQQGRLLPGRPLKELPNQSIPEFVESMTPGGGRRRVLNPELGLDEVSQVIYAIEPWVEQGKSWYKGLDWRVRRAKNYWQTRFKELLQ